MDQAVQEITQGPTGWRRFGALRPGAGGRSGTPYGWAPIVILFLVSLVDRMEFSLVPAVLVELQKEWGFSDTVAGSIPTASAVAAMLVAIPAGYLADRIDRTRLIMVTVVLWSLATLASALAPGLAAFYAIRTLLASAEAVDSPASASLLGDYYPPASRVRVFGWWRSAAYLGGLGLVVGGGLAQLLGWRGVFVVMTLPGLLVALLVSTLREPGRGVVDRMVALDGAGPDRGAAPGRAPAARSVRAQLRDVLRIRTLWFTGASLTVMSFAIGAIIYWTPTLAQRQFGLGEAAAGSVTGGLSLLGVIGGSLAGTRICRMRRSGPASEWAVLVGGLGILVGAVFIGLALTRTTWPPFAVLLVLFAFFSAFAVPTLTACVANVIPAADRGAGFGLLQIAATTGGALGPLVVGAVSDATGSLVTGMTPLIPLLLLGGTLALLARPRVEADAHAALHHSAA